MDSIRMVAGEAFDDFFDFKKFRGQLLPKFLDH